MFSIANLSKAQDTEFWFAAPHNSEQVVTGLPLNRPVFLAISNPGNTPANVQIMLYNGGSPIVFNETIPANGLYKKDFISQAEVNQIQNPRGQAGNITKYGVHIISDIDVTAYYMVNHSASRDIYTLKGKNTLGTEFYVPMQHDQYYATESFYAGAADQVDIVASEDGTSVTVIPKTTIRVGTSGSAPANAAYTKILNKGETLKIMEHTPTGGTLAGTHITATKPVAVTTTEDMVFGDTSGDQIVPVSSVGKKYIIAIGYMLTAEADRIYFVGTADNTTLTIYNGGTNVTTTINAGQSYVYNFNQSPAAQYAVYVEASNPVYAYQRTGYNEQGAALLPSMYAISQNTVTYFQVSAHHEKGILIYRDGSESGFTISYGSTTYPLSLTPISIPNVTEWKCARFDLPAAANNQIVTVSNPKGYFSFSYIAANYPTDNSTSFGYLTAFGSFRFPYDIMYKCPGSTTVIEGGYAESYKWEYSTSYNGPYTTLSETGYALTAENEGYYRLEMYQDPNIVSDTLFVRNLDFRAQILQSTTSGVTTFSSSINQELVNDPDLKISYYWEFDGGNPATSTDAAPAVTWTGKKLGAKLTVTGEANSSRSTGGCSETVYMYLMADQDVCAGKAETISGDFILPGGTPASYQWQSSKDNVAWTDIPVGGTGNSYAIPDQKRGITYYRVLMNGRTVVSEPVRIRLRSCQIPVNHNISVMGY